MDGNQPGIAGSEKQAGLIDAAAALLQRDVGLFRHDELGPYAPHGEMFQHGYGDDAIVLILEELSVGRAFARGFDTVAIVDKKKFFNVENFFYSG